jgi:hypothetical protein
MPSGHKQICIKVNAWVDEKVAPIIEALALIDGLESFTSCQDWFPDVGFAHIEFYYGYGDMKKNWKVLGFLCSKISEAFREYSVSYIYTGFHWWSDNDIPAGYIIVKPKDIENIVRAIQKLATTISLSESMTLCA